MNDTLPEMSIDLLRPLTETVINMEQSKWKIPAILGLGMAAAGLTLTYYSLQKESEVLQEESVATVEINNSI